jgi:hypothetical protein
LKTHGNLEELFHTSITSTQDRVQCVIFQTRLFYPREWSPLDRDWVISRVNRDSMMKEEIEDSVMEPANSTFGRFIFTVSCTEKNRWQIGSRQLRVAASNGKETKATLQQETRNSLLLVGKQMHAHAWLLHSDVPSLKLNPRCRTCSKVPYVYTHMWAYESNKNSIILCITY